MKLDKVSSRYGSYIILYLLNYEVRKYMSYTKLQNFKNESDIKMRNIKIMFFICIFLLIIGCSNRNDNYYIYFDPEKIKIGDQIAGFTLKSIDFDKESSTVNAYFEGEVEISGYYMDLGFFAPDLSSHLPKATYEESHENSFLLKDGPLFDYEHRMGTIIIRDYEIHKGNTELRNQAFFVRKVN